MEVRVLLFVNGWDSGLGKGSARLGSLDGWGSRNDMALKIVRALEV